LLNKQLVPTDDEQHPRWTAELVRTRVRARIANCQQFRLNDVMLRQMWAQVWVWRGNDGDAPVADDLSNREDALRTEYCNFLSLPGKFGGPIEYCCVSLLFRVRILLYALGACAVLDS